MGSKLLFILGIVAAHSALAAALVQQEAPRQRVAATSCVHVPDTALPDLTPRSEIYAAAFVRVDSISEAMRP
jgi:ribonuclease PH